MTRPYFIGKVKSQIQHEEIKMDKQQARAFLEEEVIPSVLAFNHLVGNTKSKYRDLEDTYLGLIREEGKEYFKAVAEGNLVEQLDAVCDLLYVGGFYACITKGSTTHRESWVSSLHSLITNPADRYYSYPDLLEMLQDYSVRNFDIVGAFSRVTKSNMSKAPLSYEVDPIWEMEELLEQGRYGGITFDIVGGRVIFTATKDKETGETFSKNAPKILKPSTFKSVEDLGGLEEFIKESAV